MRLFTALLSISTLLLTPCLMAQGPATLDEARAEVANYLSQFDANEDGQIQIEEIPEGRMRADLQQADTNADGIVEPDEVIAAVEEAQAMMMNPPTIGEVFAGLDLDGNGLIEGEELVDEEMAAWAAEVDADGDEAVSLDELTDWAAAQEAVQMEQQRAAITQQIIQQFDADGDGVIQIENEVPAEGPAMELAEADLDADGQVTVEELTAWLMEQAARQEAEMREGMVDHTMQQFDLDGDGAIQIETEVPDEGPAAELTEADLDGDGSVTRDELVIFAGGPAPSDDETEADTVTAEPASAI